MTTTVTPLDPASPVAERFLDTLADIQIAINARKRAAQVLQDRPVTNDRIRRKAA
jgi:hypothetical protein